MFKRFFVLLLKKLKILSAVSIKLTKITGKSKEEIHPKHLVKFQAWYLKYLGENDTVLDVGCNNGQHTMKAAKIVKHITGIDIDSAELGKAKREAARKNLHNIKFLKISAEKKLNFKANSFDKLLFFDVVEHLENQDLALSEIHRVLKKGGLLLIAAPNRNTSWKKLQKSVGLPYFSDPDHKREYSENEISRLLKKHNFKILGINPVVFDTPLAPIFDLIGAFSISTYSKLSDWKRQRAYQNPAESTGFEIVAIK